jgi:hypothetical protein
LFNFVELFNVFWELLFNLLDLRSSNPFPTIFFPFKQETFFFGHQLKDLFVPVLPTATTQRTYFYLQQQQQQQQQPKEPIFADKKSFYSAYQEFRSQFHQHFKRCFFANFLALKSINLNFKHTKI